MSTNILDLRNFIKKPIDNSIVFALDTNVLLWTFYSRISTTREYQKTSYPDFVTSAIANGNSLVVTAFNLNEMFHIIEKNEFDIYEKATIKKITIKNYRKIDIERLKVKKEIELIYKQLISIPNINIIGSTVDISDLNNFTYNYNIHNCDFFDFCLIDYCNKNKISIITDDSDFCNPYNNSDVYTANPRVI